MGQASTPEPQHHRAVPGQPIPADVRHRDTRLIHAVMDTGADDRHPADFEALPAALIERCAELQDRVAQLQTALNSRVVIEQAKGVLAERHRLTVDSAFEMLRCHARRNNLRLHDLAGAVVDGQQLAVRSPVAG